MIGTVEKVKAMVPHLIDRGKGFLKNSRLGKNLSWIFFGNVLHSLLGFFVSIYVARKLTTNDYGLINYASAWISFFSCISGLGLTGVLTKCFAEDPEHTGNHLCTAMLAHFGAGLISAAGLYGVVYLTDPGEPILYLIVLLHSITMPLSMGSLLVYWFRYIGHADTVAIIRFATFFATSAWRIAALTFIPDEETRLIVYLIGTSSETLLFTACLLIFYVKYREKGEPFRFSMPLLKKMLRLSYPFIFAALMVQVYSHTDQLMLKQMMDANEVAMYAAAVRFATAISIIPSTLLEAFRPEVMDAKVKDQYLYEKRFRQVYCIIFWSSVSYCLFVTIFAKQIILIFYTEKYLGAIGALSLAVWYSTFAYFGPVNSMYMVAEEKHKWVQVTTLTGAVCNVICNYFAIPVMGAAGAALASLISQCVTQFVMILVIPDLRPCAKLMFGGVTFRDVF